MVKVANLWSWMWDFVMNQQQISQIYQKKSICDLKILQRFFKDKILEDDKLQTQSLMSSKNQLSKRYPSINLKIKRRLLTRRILRVKENKITVESFQTLQFFSFFTFGYFSQ
ncbi:hypothetical protein ACKWTF_004493 [Chironomus riparius]